NRGFACLLTGKLPVVAAEIIGQRERCGLRREQVARKRGRRNTTGWSVGRRARIGVERVRHVRKTLRRPKQQGGDGNRDAKAQVAVKHCGREPYQIPDARDNVPAPSAGEVSW